MKTLQLTALCGAFTLGSLSPAQAGNAAAPVMLPGDAPPPTLSQMTQSHGSGAPHAPDPTPSPPAVLGVDAAQTAIVTCTDTASGVRVAVAVIDSAGVLRVAVAADGALPGRVFEAARKALTAIEFKAPTSEAYAQLAVDHSLKARIKPNMIVSPGALPLIVDGHLMGAIGVSGGTDAQNERCASAGAARILDKFK
jgi:uncharacterized protein GlcG (DUF336 family)